MGNRKGRIKYWLMGFMALMLCPYAFGADSLARVLYVEKTNGGAVCYSFSNKVQYTEGRQVRKINKSVLFHMDAYPLCWAEFRTVPNSTGTAMLFEDSEMIYVEIGVVPSILPVPNTLRIQANPKQEFNHIVRLSNITFDSKHYIFNEDDSKERLKSALLDIISKQESGRVSFEVNIDDCVRFSFINIKKENIIYYLSIAANMEFVTSSAEFDNR